jgi:aspartate-semialdehyde dehydrogenase
MMLQRIKRIVVSTYQAVSGTGLKAIEELEIQTKDIMNGFPFLNAKYTLIK